jgi:purine-binding chemotaxis protein CheW
MDIKDADIEKAPEIGLKLHTQYLYGIAQLNERMLIILNMDNILSSEDEIDLSALNSMKSEEKSE